MGINDTCSQGSLSQLEREVELAASTRTKSRKLLYLYRVSTYRPFDKSERHIPKTLQKIIQLKGLYWRTNYKREKATLNGRRKKPSWWRIFWFTVSYTVLFSRKNSLITWNTTTFRFPAEFRIWKKSFFYNWTQQNFEVRNMKWQFIAVAWHSSVKPWLRMVLLSTLTAVGVMQVREIFKSKQQCPLGHIALYI